METELNICVIYDYRLVKSTEKTSPIHPSVYDSSSRRHSAVLDSSCSSSSSRAESMMFVNVNPPLTFPSEGPDTHSHDRARSRRPLSSKHLHYRQRCRRHDSLLWLRVLSSLDNWTFPEPSSSGVQLFAQNNLRFDQQK